MAWSTNPGQLGELPRALSLQEISEEVKQYRQAAKNALMAGFDGVEIHGANGYLIDEFLCDSSNERKDTYGGSIENRCRFCLEVVDACCQEIGSDRVGIRFSPFGARQIAMDSNPQSQIEYLFSELNKRGIAYVHVIEPRGRHRNREVLQPDDVTERCRSCTRGF
eukprot:TRINITY_DN5035_c0_g1_i1.p1 TRINITY_DN5035_c0_g1~~TRINITY_DN5035_c0_g1_i1.p1  ORF type:complete len:165 (+),score=28.55 TRINITY_DN5035_c0_g1_i1:350-844(+)